MEDIKEYKFNPPPVDPSKYGNWVTLTPLNRPTVEIDDALEKAGDSINNLKSEISDLKGTLKGEKEPNTEDDLPPVVTLEQQLDALAEEDEIEVTDTFSNDDVEDISVERSTEDSEGLSFTDSESLAVKDYIDELTIDEGEEPPKLDEATLTSLTEEMGSSKEETSFDLEEFGNSLETDSSLGEEVIANSLLDDIAQEEPSFEVEESELEAKETLDTLIGELDNALEEKESNLDVSSEKSNLLDTMTEALNENANELSSKDIASLSPFEESTPLEEVENSLSEQDLEAYISPLDVASEELNVEAEGEEVDTSLLSDEDLSIESEDLSLDIESFENEVKEESVDLEDSLDDSVTEVLNESEEVSSLEEFNIDKKIEEVNLDSPPSFESKNVSLDTEALENEMTEEDFAFIESQGGEADFYGEEGEEADIDLDEAFEKEFGLTDVLISEEQEPIKKTLEFRSGGDAGIEALTESLTEIDSTKSPNDLEQGEESMISDEIEDSINQVETLLKMLPEDKAKKMLDKTQFAKYQPLELSDEESETEK